MLIATIKGFGTEGILWLSSAGCGTLWVFVHLRERVQISIKRAAFTKDILHHTWTVFTALESGVFFE